MDIRLHNTIVVGTGAAGYNAADRLHAFGQTDVAMVTEGVSMGTSRNTGSDKQTYYKLTLAGGSDSIRELAQTLFDGQCVDGDIALCEAALSVPCFLHLTELGVPFPQNRWGEYVGYKTDHDPRQRATSVGPYTSREMTRRLQQAVESRGIPVYDRMQAVRILRDEHRVRGLLCLDTERNTFVVFCCENLILATGGPAGMYADSVYPVGHNGASGVALEAGVSGRNLTEWQFGLASRSPRWNVSGTYMQVLPRFISVDEQGTEREFLREYYTDPGTLLSNVFLKGYQWPFDVKKTDGSSRIDLLVSAQQQLGRRVYLDFRTNPEGLDFSRLAPEARDYLEKTGACFGTPYERLVHMNAPAAEFYREHGVDLQKEPLEIALCVQHNNGGLAVDCWWQTDLPHLFAVGECAGTHGVCRPGGSALNAGQVGSTRAAQFLARRFPDKPRADEGFLRLAQDALQELEQLIAAALGTQSNVQALHEAASRRMSRAAGAIRTRAAIREARRETEALLADFSGQVRIRDRAECSALFRLRDVLIAQSVYLRAMEDYLLQGGGSRGSALYPDAPEDHTNGLLQEIRRTPAGMEIRWRRPRPIPAEDDVFETVWRNYRETGNVYEGGTP